MCLRCMRKIGENTSCPYCRNEITEPQKAPYLPLKTVVGGRYLIGKLVCSNGEGSTYNAFDLETKTPVTLRELFPSGLLTRGEGNYCLVNVGKASEFIDVKAEFVKLWNKLSSLRGFTAFTRVTNIFEDLGTVYAVSEFLGDGKTLRDYLLEKEQGYISWDEARVLFMPVISALDELHSAGIVHGGISPTTLVIDSNGKLRITGYCVADMRNEKSVMSSELFEGYAAVEQYGMSRGLGEYTDIYAFAAVLYRALIGSTPIGAASRLTNDKLMIPGRFAEKLPAYVINALVNGLQVLPEDRTQSFEELRNELSASPSAAVNAAEAYTSIYDTAPETNGTEAPLTTVAPAEDDEYDEYDDYESEDKNSKKKTVIAFVVSAVVCLVVLISILAGFGFFSDDETDADSGNSREQTTEDVGSAEDEITENETEIGNISMKIPNFVGKSYDDIDIDEYKQVLTFKTEYIDSDEDIGTVVSQSLNAGTEVNSLNKRTITLKISDGLMVPDVVGESIQDAMNMLKDEGFKNVELESGQVASSSEESNKVYRVVYDDGTSSDWSEIPDDGRLSASDTIILYYYGEYSEPVEESETDSTEQSADSVGGNTVGGDGADTDEDIATDVAGDTVV